MKVGLYSPFMAENIGGGERYFLQVAECLLEKGHNVDLIFQDNFLKNQKHKNYLKQKYAKAFNLNIDKLNFINGPFGRIGSSFVRLKFTKKYDIFYYMTDGSFFVPGARKNLVHFMIPFKNLKGGFFNRLKLNAWQAKTANSFFTKRQIEKNWRMKIDHVHWTAAVDKKEFKPLAKKKIILNVGRFFSATGIKHCKRQDILINVFKKMCDQGLKGWRLILAGSIDKGKDNEVYARKVRKLTKNYPIIIKHEISFKQLQKYYGQAKIYWHATGFGLDENEKPEAMEHLGISTIEGMAAGCVPIVINKGGQKEIITNEKNGLLWETKEELIEKTLEVMKNKKLWKKLSDGAQKRANDFSKEKFCKRLKEIFKI